MFNKQFQMFRQAKEKVAKAISTRFWGEKKTTSFNIPFSDVFPGKSPKGPNQDKPSGWLIGYRKKRDKLNRIAFESRRNNWRK